MERKDLLKKYCHIKELWTEKECDDHFAEFLTLDFPIATGLDVEYGELSPNDTSKFIPMTLQISVDAETYIIRLHNFVTLPNNIKLFLKNKNIIKVGVAIDMDIKHLKEIYGNLDINSFIDLRNIVKKSGLRETQFVSLAAMTKNYLGLTLSESPANWHTCDYLDEEQIMYAASDSFYGLQLFHLFCNCIDSSKFIICSFIYQRVIADILKRDMRWYDFIKEYIDMKYVPSVHKSYIKRSQERHRSKKLFQSLYNLSYDISTWNTEKIEYLQSICYGTLETRSARNGFYGHLLESIIELCIAWRWNFSDKFLSETYHRLLLYAQTIEKQLKQQKLLYNKQLKQQKLN